MATTTGVLDIRRADERGVTEIGWLHGRHSFSFNRYYNPDRMGFRSLRVINDDIVEPARGFGEHPHDNMEILTWILQGALKHRDSTGGEGIIRPGELQAMSAGTGIRHSEMNASTTDHVHLLQIWIEPAERNLTPSYSQKPFASDGRHNRWQVLASNDGRDSSLQIHQDALMMVADLEANQELELPLRDARYGYLHIAFGTVLFNNDVTLHAGDAVTLQGRSLRSLRAVEQSQAMLFDLA